MKQAIRRVTKGVVAGTITGVILAYASVANAEPRTHDGFYMQLDAGLGYLSSSAEAGGFEVTYSGVTFPTGLLLGGTVGPVAIGGGFFCDYTPGPSVSVGGESTEVDDASLALIGLGLFADFYPDPHGGLHFQPFVGWGGLEATYRGNSGGSDPTGLVLAIGAGHDWWVGDEWSIGVMGRFAYGALSMNDVSYSTIAPSILATFTFH